MWIESVRPPQNLEYQLEQLALCGIRLAPGIDIRELLECYTREEFEENPYLNLLLVMGFETTNEPYRPLSENIWNFDTECIEGAFSYEEIAERLRLLAGDALPLVGIRAGVDYESGDQYWVEFSLDGTTYRWSVNVDRDWVDTEIFTKFANILESRHAARRFTYLNLEAQNFLMGCSTPEQLDRLRGVTGLNFTWLS